MRDLLLRLHLWLGLATGAVVAVVCLTGAILVFEPEVLRALHPERYAVAPGATRVPIAAATERLAVVQPGARVTGAVVHAAADRPYELLTDSGRAFVDPYSGEVIAAGVSRPVFFTKVFGLHRWLLADEPGKQIVGASTIAFLLILVSGAIIWVPRRREGLRARASIVPILRRGTGWKRRTHDLHVVLGIYAAPVLAVLAFTGLAWSYDWFNDGIYRVTRSPKAPPAPLSVGDSTASGVDLDVAHAAALATMAPARTITIRLPARADAAVAVTALPHGAPHDRATDALYLDRWTGAELRHDRWSEMSLGVRARRTFYPVHTGAIWGMPSRVVAFAACLLGASFPVTGFLMWWRKWRRRRLRAGLEQEKERGDEGAPAELPPSIAASVRGG